MLLKLTVVLIMLVGLCMTLLPRAFGTLIIAGAAVLYAVVAGPAAVPPWLWAILALLAAVAEVGGRLLRVWLTRRYSLSRRFCLGSSLGNAGGILAADALFGPVVGLLVWELVAGKTLAPRWDVVGRVLLRLAAAAVVRLVCGLVMIILVLLYVL